MAKRVTVSTLNAKTIDIINAIRQNASPQYRDSVPVVTQSSDIPKVGEVIFGYPAFANEFITALVNRIGLVMARSMIFNNPYSRLKKGFLQYGEVVEEIFVNIAKALHYDPEKANAREFKRYIPDVKAGFHAVNWKVLYPVSIQENELRQAFLTEDGVSDLISRIIDGLYRANEYDEFLLFKYMLIKAVSRGEMYPVEVGDGSDLRADASSYRGVSNLMTFPKTEYNAVGVLNNTPRERQVIFMDSLYNGKFDVEVLASAFNMDKATFLGSQFLVDDWNTFDNERFETIRAESTGLEEVTAQELRLMNNIRGIMLDEDWFQVYDQLMEFREVPVASGLYWNYFLHVWKVISSSPFANAVVFVQAETDIALPESFIVKVASKSDSAEAVVFTLETQIQTPTLKPSDIQFVQTKELTSEGIAVHPYGAVIIPASKFASNVTLTASINGEIYVATSPLNHATDVDVTFELSNNPSIE